MVAHLDPTNFAEGPVFAFVGNAANHVSPDAMPADTVPFYYLGGDPGGNFRVLGYSTEDGVSHSGLSPEQTPQMTAQSRNAVSYIRGTRTPAVAMTLLEVTPENFALAIGGAAITDTATSESVEVSDEEAINFVSLLIEAFGPKGRPLRIFYPMVQPNITGDIVNRIGQNMALPVSFSRVGGAESNPEWRFLKP
jgi:hypothetical protein